MTSNCIADGLNAHVEGALTVAHGAFSHAEGYSTIANYDYQHVAGRYNIADTENRYAFIFGNGKSDSNRSNGMTVDWDGNLWVAGDIESGTAGNLSEKCTHHRGYCSSDYASLQTKVISVDNGIRTLSDIESDESTTIYNDEDTPKFNVRHGDLITIYSESSNTFSVTSQNGIYFSIDGEPYAVKTFTLITGTNTSYYGSAGRLITYWVDKTNMVLWYFSKNWDNDTTYKFNTAYNSSTNKVATMTDVNNAVSGLAKTSDITNAVNALDVSAIGGSDKYISTVSEVNGKISATAVTIGTVKNAQNKGVTVESSSAYSSLCNITITVGTWLVCGSARFGSMTAGKDKRSMLSTTEDGTILNNAGGYMRTRGGGSEGHTLATYAKVTKNTTIYLCVVQANGESITMDGFLSAIKIA